MTLRLLAASALLLAIAGCSANPAKCDLAKAPDSRHCAAKEADLRQTCRQAAAPQRQQACDTAAAFSKERLTGTLLDELGGILPTSDERKKNIARIALSEDLDPVLKRLYDADFFITLDVVRREWCPLQAQYIQRRLLDKCTLEEAIGHTKTAATTRVGISCLEGLEAADAAQDYAFTALMERGSSLKSEAEAQALFDLTKEWFNSKDTALTGSDRKNLVLISFVIYAKQQDFKKAELEKANQ